MDKEEARRLKEELNESFSDEYINNAGLLLHRLAEAFYRENDLEGHVNYVKFIAYTASWCLKRKPFQLIEGCDEKYLYVNETFALSLLLQASGCLDEDAGYYEEDREALIDEIRQIFYHLKYRNTNPQTLELFLIGMRAGKKIRDVK